MGKFTQHWASDYDLRIVRLIPGYGMLHEIASCVLAAHLQGAAGEIDVLVAGAGTGRELDDLAARDPAWRFTAIDSSQPMLDIARARAVTGNYVDRVAFHAMDMQAYLAKTPHAAALAILVMHFLSDDAGRLAFLQTLARSLRPGASLLLFDYAGDVEEFHPAYRQWARAQGMDEEAIETMFLRLNANFHPIVEAQLKGLLAEAGFGVPTRFFQALGYCAYVVHRN
jgi:tRNA (cmo5U34)-methyltransferase